MKAGSLEEVKACSPPAFSVRLLCGPRVAISTSTFAGIIRLFDGLLIIVAALKAIKTSKFADIIRLFDGLLIMVDAFTGHPRSTFKAGSLEEMKAWSPPGFSVRLLGGPRVASHAHP